MKPTDEERREVAKRMRDFEQLRGVFNESSVCAFSDALGVGYMDWEHICARLADLIEPEERTCERGIEMFSHAYPNEIVCDSDCVSTYVFPLTCGHEVELLENKWPSYCPHCGARVVTKD